VDTVGLHPPTQSPHQTHPRSTYGCCARCGLCAAGVWARSAIMACTWPNVSRSMIGRLHDLLGPQPFAGVVPPQLCRVTEADVVNVDEDLVLAVWFHTW
jgi:hypothetical protein